MTTAVVKDDTAYEPTVAGAAAEELWELLTIGGFVKWDTFLRKVPSGPQHFLLMQFLVVFEKATAHQKPPKV